MSGGGPTYAGSEVRSETHEEITTQRVVQLRERVAVAKHRDAVGRPVQRRILVRNVVDAEASCQAAEHTDIGERIGRRYVDVVARTQFAVGGEGRLSAGVGVRTV